MQGGAEKNQRCMLARDVSAYGRKGNAREILWTTTIGLRTERL